MKLHLAEITGYIQGVSTTSNTVGTGSKTFVLTKNVKFFPGMSVLADDGSGNTMTATVTSYSEDTKTLVLNVSGTAGSGTHAAWTIGGEYVFRFSSKKGFRTSPSETPARAIYLNRLLEPGSFQVSIYRQGIVGGRAEVGYGVIEVDNTDGVLDHLKYVAFDGRSLVIRYGESEAAYPSGFTTLFTGTMQGSELEYSRVRFLLRDRQAEVFSKKAQGPRTGISDNTFAGTNSAGNGIEGGSDIKDKPKPICYGKVRNIQPPCVNTSKFIYQVNWRAVNSIDAVYSGGVALTPGTARASTAALESNVPSAGTFDYYIGSGSTGAYFRIASDLQTQITADVTEGASAGARTVAQIMKKILIDLGEIDTGEISASDVTALDSSNSSVIGLWIGTEERDIAALIDDVAKSVGAFLTLDRLGVWRMGQLKAPSGAAAATLKQWQIKNNGQKVQRIAPNDDDRGIPNYRVKVYYQQNYTRQNAGDLNGAAASRVNFTAYDFRDVSSSDNTVLTKHPLSKVKELTSLIDAESDAQAFADDRKAIFKEERETVAVTLDFENAPVLNLNDVVTLDVPRYDWNGGKDFRLVGIDNQFRKNEVTLTLWG